MLGRPEIERHRCHLVHQRNGVAVDRQINRLEVVMAGIAGFYADSREIFRRIAGKFFVVSLPASGTQNAAELPLCQTKRTQQKTLAPIAFGT